MEAGQIKRPAFFIFGNQLLYTFRLWLCHTLVQQNLFEHLKKIIVYKGEYTVTFLINYLITIAIQHISQSAQNTSFFFAMGCKR